MSKVVHSPHSSTSGWDIESELDAFRQELDEQFQVEKEQLANKRDDALKNLEEVSDNTILKTKDEWTEYEERLNVAEKSQKEKIQSFSSSLSKQNEMLPILDELTEWIYNNITSLKN